MTQPEAIDHQEQLQTGENPAVQEFVEQFEERFRSAHEGDLHAVVREDLPAAIESNDTMQAQALLENGWGSRRAKPLNEARRDALLELRGTNLDTITIEQRRAATTEAQEAIRGATHRGDRGTAYNTINGGRTTSEEHDAAISFLEDLITDESTVNPDSDKLERLRLARDIAHSSYKFNKEYAHNKREFAERVTALAREEDGLTPAELEHLSGPLFGETAHNMRIVLAAAEQTDDPKDREALLAGIRDKSIPVENPAAFKAWEHTRAAAQEQAAEAAHQAHVAEKRREMEEVFKNMR